MKRMMKLLLPLCLIMALLLPTLALADDSDGTLLTVRGTAQINVAPDRAVLSIGV